MSRGPGRVLALRALGLGDLLTAVPALRALRAAFPEHRLQLAAPAGLEPLVLAAALADEVVGLDLRAGAGPAPAIPPPDALHRADVAVNLHGRGPQSTRLLRATAPARLIAFAPPGAEPGPDRPGWREDEHEVERWCRLLEQSGIAADPRRLDLPPVGEAPPAAIGATLLHPGAASPARRWPEERWTALARMLAEAGRRPVLTGGPDEAALADRIAAGAGLGPEAVLAGRTDLLALTAAVRAAAQVVCGDTGVAHLATAAGTASVVLFGPVSPERWGPPRDRPQHRVLWAGRLGDPHGQALDPGLGDIAVADVLDALEQPGSGEVREGCRRTAASPR